MQEPTKTRSQSDKPGVVWEPEVVPQLLSQLKGTVVHPDEAKYDVARAVWNGRIDRRPGLIVHAANEVDVVACVNVVRDHGIPLAVRGAGHHPAGFGTMDHGLVLDLSAMTDIQIDATDHTARIQPGVTTGAFFQAIEAQGLVTTVGSHPPVSMAGLTLGGGIGALMGRYGLACDNLLEATVITANAQRHTASEQENPDLFWALRGGGGSVGVVTSLTYRLYPAEPVLHGFLIYPIEKAREVLSFVREFNANPQLPDALTVTAALLTGPGGHPVCLINPCYTGPLEEGEKLIAPLRQFGTPFLDTIHPAPYSELISFFADKDPAGNHYSYSCQGLADLTDDVIETMATFGAAVTSPLTVVVLYHLHGAARRVPATSTAFPARDVPYFLGIYTGWSSDDTDTPHEGWHTGFQAAIEPDGCGGGYLNLMSRACDSAPVAAWYGQNASRLAAIKSRWDPTNLFSSTPDVSPPKNA